MGVAATSLLPQAARLPFSLVRLHAPVRADVPLLAGQLPAAGALVLGGLSLLAAPVPCVPVPDAFPRLCAPSLVVWPCRVGLRRKLFRAVALSHTQSTLVALSPIPACVP